MNHALRPTLLAATDLSVGGLLYLQVSAALGVVLFIAGLVVLCGVVYEMLPWRLDVSRVRRTPVSMT